jgi:hypothetical protein
MSGAENRENEPEMAGSNHPENEASWGPHPKVRAPAAKYASVPVRQAGTMFSAVRPFWPCAMSNDTF